jgi:hypothetical protein
MSIEVGTTTAGLMLTIAMKHFFRVMCLLYSFTLFACAAQSNTPSGESSPSKRMTASGYTKEGCLLNLKVAAREQSMRLDPNDLDASADAVALIFPFLNREGYHCSGAVSERPKRSRIPDPLYPIN